MSQQLPTEQINELKEAFALYDPMATGFMKTKDLESLVRSLGFHLTEAELLDNIAELDESGSGTISLEQFMQMATHKLKFVYTEEELQEAFRVFDKSCDGFLSAGEIKLVATHLGEIYTDQEVEEMIREIDTDGDGVINFEEFFDMMTFKARDY